MLFQYSVLFALITGGLAQDASTTAYIDVSQTRASSNHPASAFIYGMPLNFNPNQIPDHFYTDIGIRYGRAGGAQQEAPCRGWAFGQSEYSCRFDSVLLNYYQTRKFGAEFIILPHDMWGVDYKDSISNYTFPGDNGDWSNYDAFLDQLISDIKSHGITSGLIWDIWNEPDIYGYWQRSIDQWVELYTRTHQRIRSDADLNGVLISGPTLANSPDVANQWWTAWAKQVSATSTFPDQYAWHYEGGGDSSDPDISDALFRTLLSTYGLPTKPVNINEYATAAEETPSGYAWWISRLERYEYAGLLGLWHAPLYDNFANLLTKSPGDPTDTTNTNYVGAAGFPLYRYYASSMTGPRAKTTGSTDRKFDTFATVGSSGDKVRILAGSRVVTGDYTIHISGLGSVGYSDGSTLNAAYYAYYGSDNIFDAYGDEPFLGTQSVTVVNGAVNLDVNCVDVHTGFRIEFPHL